MFNERYKLFVFFGILLLIVCIEVFVSLLTTPSGHLSAESHQISRSSTEPSLRNSGENLISYTEVYLHRVYKEKTYNETFLDILSGFTDVLARPPIAFLPNFKNPCWIEKASKISYNIVDDDFKGQIRCLPYFFLAGFPKSGTTDLFSRLAIHPKIQTPCVKEPHWWCKSRQKAGKSMLTYLKCFDRAAVRIARSKNYTAIVTEPRDHITADGSASTLWDHSNWRYIPQNNLTADEPTVTNVHCIHHLLPNAKMIVIMRNPTDRLYSDYLNFQTGLSASKFHLYVNESIALLESCFKKRTTRACLYDSQLIRGLPVRLHIGIYSMYIEDWFQLYPRDQFMFLQTEDYRTNITTAMINIFKFLDLDIPKASKLHNIEKKPKANTRPREKKNLGELFPETRIMLKKFYSPWNKRLAKLLNDNRFLWEG